MKKKVYLKPDGKHGNLQIRVAAREALLDEFHILAVDNPAIVEEIRRHITHVKDVVSRLRLKKDDDLELMLLRDCMIIWLLGSEPATRRRALLLFSMKQGVSVQSNTTFFALILKSLGLYSPQDRRKLNRDATAVEFAMTQGMRPSTLIKYFKTPGQGRDATYRRATGQSARAKQNKLHDTTLCRKVRGRIERLSPGRQYITLTKRTATGSTVQSCLFDPGNVKAVLEFIHKRLSNTPNPNLDITC